MPSTAKTAILAAPLLLAAIAVTLTAAPAPGRSRRAADTAASPAAAPQASARAAARDAVRASCPDSVAEGEPFVVALEVASAVQALSVQWLDLSLNPPRMLGEAERLTLLLGMGLRGRQEDGAPALRLRWRTAAGEDSLRLNVHRKAKRYPEQRLSVDRRYSEPSAEELARHERERAQVRAALATVSPRRLWQAPLLRPVPGATSSVFGLRRVFNDEPASPHAGVDLRAAAGDPVSACADGRVILTGDHFYAGKSVYLDHGQGLISMYFHLSEIAVADGETVRAGQRIGRAGATGRVTAAHLHWGASLWGQLVDPLVLMELTGLARAAGGR